MRSVWYHANQLGNVDQMDKAAKYHNWIALPLRSVTVDGPPFSVPRYLHLDLGKPFVANTVQRGTFQVTFPCAASRDKKLGTS